jgi:hypothetical protein
MTANGELTARLARTLSFEGCEVFYDHDPSSDHVGRIVSYIGENARSVQLSQLDIAVVLREEMKNTKPWLW